MIEKGIIDPAKVVRIALQDAASIAGLMITTEVGVAEASQKGSRSCWPRSWRYGFGYVGCREMQCVAADVTVACDVALSLRPIRRLYLGIVKNICGYTARTVADNRNKSAAFQSSLRSVKIPPIC